MLLHKDVYMPGNLIGLCGEVRLVWSSHAEHAAKSDRYGTVPVVNRIDFSNAELIEAELAIKPNTKPVINKLVYRLDYDYNLDIVFVVIPGANYFTVKTVWLNEKSDKHYTLDRSKYYCPN